MTMLMVNTLKLSWHRARDHEQSGVFSTGTAVIVAATLAGQHKSLSVQEGLRLLK